LGGGIDSRERGEEGIERERGVKEEGEGAG